MPKSPITIIHVNRNIIDSNRKHGTNLPAITVKQGRSNRYAHTVDILGPSKFVYSPDKPLKCGARLWIETESALILA